MMAQLRYSGVLETVRIRKEGFPVRLPFQVFIDRYFRWVVPSRTDSSPRALFTVQSMLDSTWEI